MTLDDLSRLITIPAMVSVLATCTNPEQVVVRAALEAAANPLPGAVCALESHSRDVDHLLTLSRGQCPGCEAIGYFLRHRETPGLLEIPPRLAIATTVSDTGAVCDYLRRERVEIRVVTLEANEVVRRAMLDTLFLLVRPTPEAEFKVERGANSFQAMFRPAPGNPP